MANEASVNGTSKETLKLFLKITWGVVGVLVALNAFLLKEIFFGSKADAESKEPNTQLLKMFEKQVEINGKMAMATASMAESAERMAASSENGNEIMAGIASQLDIAMKRQVTKKELGGLKEQISKIKNQK